MPVKDSQSKAKYQEKVLLPEGSVKIKLNPVKKILLKPLPTQG